jgi:hypothetical protein
MLVSSGGRLIFRVSDVDRFWAYLMEKGFYPDSPQDASWGQRYFHSLPMVRDHSKCCI